MKITHNKINASISSARKQSTTIEGAYDTGLEYWYLTKHGLGPGMMPPDVKLLDCIEDGWDTYILLDKLLSLHELKYYDIKEKAPSQELIDQHNSEKDPHTPLAASECTKVAEDDESIDYVVGSEDIEATSIVYYNNYRITSSPMGWSVLDNDRNTIKDGFLTEKQAKDYIDNIGASTDVCSDYKDYEEPIVAAYDYDEEDVDDEYPEDFDIDIVFDKCPIKVTKEMDVIEDPTFWDDFELPWFDEIQTGTGSYECTLPTFDDIQEDTMSIIGWNIPNKAGTYICSGKIKLVYKPKESSDFYYYSCDMSESEVASDWTYTYAGDKEEESVEGSTKIEASMTEEELDKAILEGEPFDLKSFKKYKSEVIGEDILRADQIEVGDKVKITEDASEVSPGTVVEILGINDPEDDWWTPKFGSDSLKYFTFNARIIENPEDGLSGALQAGDLINLHYTDDDYVGPLVLN